MSKELKNNIKSLQALADATMNPIFITALLYVKRTGNTITLDGVGMEKEDGITL